MRVVALLLILLVIGTAVAAALGWGDRMVSVPVDRAPAGFPPVSDISAGAVPHLRFNLALRGYRMAEVDLALAQLADALAACEQRIADLEAEAEGGMEGGGRTEREGRGKVSGDGAKLSAAAGRLGSMRIPSAPFATDHGTGTGTATLPAPGPDAIPPAPPAPPAPGPDPVLPSPPLDPPGPSQPPTPDPLPPDPASMPRR